MKIYVMRHGQAQFYADSDSQRPLSAAGITQSENMANWLREQHKTPIQRAWVSPYLRAQQTFSVLNKCVEVSDGVETLDSLTPHGDEFDVVNYLNAVAETSPISSLVIVSHLPLVGYLSAAFLKSNNVPMFSTASMAAIEYNAKKQKGELLWFKHANDLA